jgi:hypothetical protein
MVPGSKKIGWGGRRKGAGRKRELHKKDRVKIAFLYFSRMQRRPGSKGGGRPPRKATIHTLAVENGVTARMIERALAEFLPKIRACDAAMSEFNEGWIRPIQIEPWKRKLKILLQEFEES